MRKTFRVGRRIGQRPENLAKRANTMRVHSEQIGAWKPSPSDISLDAYIDFIFPALARVSTSEIRKVIGVSEPHSSDTPPPAAPFPPSIRRASPVARVTRKFSE